MYERIRSHLLEFLRNFKMLEGKSGRVLVEELVESLSYVDGEDVTFKRLILHWGFV
jgi:hypothetical protein